MAPTILNRKFIFFNSAVSENYIQNPTELKSYLDPSTFEIFDEGVYFRYFINELTFRNDVKNINPSNKEFSKDGVPLTLSEGKPEPQDIVDELASLGITCSYDDSTNYLTFYTDTPYTLDFTSISSCAPVLGFTEGNVYTITNGFIPDNQIDLDQDVLYIMGNYTNSNYTVINNETQFTNVMGVVSLLAQPYQILNFSDPTGEYAIVERTLKNIQTLVISFGDSNGKPLTLNSNFTCSLCIEYLKDYEIDIISQLIALNKITAELLTHQRRESILRDLEKQKEKKKAKKIAIPIKEK